MDEKTIVVNMGYVIVSLVVGIALGAFAFQRIQEVQVPVITDQTVKTCLDNGGTFTATDILGPEGKCVIPEHQLIYN